MINVKITMVNGYEYNVRNIAPTLKEFYKNVLAAYGTTTTFVEIIPGEIIHTGNIISMREMSDGEVEILETEELHNPAIVSDKPEIVEDVVARPQDVPKEKIEENNIEEYSEQTHESK